MAVGQAVGLIPHPAAKAARVVWTATGAMAMNNKLADVSQLAILIRVAGLIA
jgi:hypothetical protein